MPAPCETRLAQLQAMLAGRTDPAGNPLKGYGKSVVAIRYEIARLEDVAAIKNPLAKSDAIVNATLAHLATLLSEPTAPPADSTESAKPVFRPHKLAVDTAPGV